MECLTTIFCILSIANFLSLASSSSSPATAVFAFGDSTLDAGNNNGLATLLHSNHPPYGRSFPGHVATGRFTDGKLTTDFVVAKMGVKEVLPAYLDPRLTDDELLTGVSFASAGSGLDELTATEVSVLTMPTQLRYFEQALQRIQRRVGAEEASRIVGGAVFVIGAGTNDMIDNFYELPTRRMAYSLSAYHDFLLQKLEWFIQSLYKMGGRRFAVTGLPPIGCLPLQVTVGGMMPPPGGNLYKRACVNQQNADSEAYNTKLQVVISTLQSNLIEAKVVYADIYSPFADMIDNPSKYGFEHTLEGCCGTVGVEMGPLCSPIAPTCSDSSKYVFWDAVHPTQAAYSILANLFQRTVLPQLLGQIQI